MNVFADAKVCVIAETLPASDSQLFCAIVPATAAPMITKAFSPATIVAGGDVAVMAKDDSEVVVVAGAVAIGLSGGGAAGSVAVVTIDKLTEATIGDNASVDASGNGAGIGDAHGN